jgi:putative membrane protein
VEKGAAAENAWLRGIVWGLFAATMYLILGEALWAWVQLPILGNVGFTLIFVLFALTHCAVLEGFGRTAVFFAISAVVSYGMEEIGVRSGRIYGAYHYSDLLGAKLGHVPVIIPLAWFMMIYPSWMVARELLKGVDSRSLAGITGLAAVSAWVMTAWDLAMDPGMARGGVWVWENGGAYFGVPLQNYVGWLLTTFIVYWIVGLLWRPVKVKSRGKKIFDALPVIVYAFFAVRYITPARIPALQIVALFSMGMAALVALIRLALIPAAVDEN